MAHDKKVDRGMLRFVVLETLGRATIRGDIQTEQVAAALGI